MTTTTQTPRSEIETNRPTCGGCPTVRECQRIAAECPNVSPAIDSQHARDSAELRSLCQARDDARRERDLLTVEAAQLREQNTTLDLACAKQEGEIASLRAQLEAVGAGGVGKLMGGGAVPLLAKQHTGMRVDYRGLLRQSQEGLRKEPGLAEMLRQLGEHLTELGTRWYAGDVAVVDEILQLYCIEKNARAEVCQRLGVHRNTLTAYMSDKDFPKPAKDGKWLLSEIVQWESER